MKIVITIIITIALAFAAVAGAERGRIRSVAGMARAAAAAGRGAVLTATSRTGKAVCSLNNQELALTNEETQELLTLLAGVQASTPLCAPADCFYLNLQTADGTWLMSLPVQNMAEGIVLLYLKLQGNNAGAPLQSWWKSVSTRLGI